MSPAEADPGLIGTQRQLLLNQVTKSHQQEAEAAVAAIRETRNQAEAEYRHALSDDLAKAEQKASGLAQDLIKAEQRTRPQLLTAPVDGVVQQLAIHTVGGLVTPAQSLYCGAECRGVSHRCRIC